MSLWVVSADYGTWVVRAGSETDALEIAADGPAEDGELTARDVAADIATMEARRLVVDGPPMILDSVFG